MYRVALDISQVKPEQVVYIDDREMFVEVARGLGITGITHTSYEATRKSLEGVGTHFDQLRFRPDSRCKNFNGSRMKGDKMQIGMIGLGRMGANMVQRLMKDGHECVVFDMNTSAISKARGSRRNRSRLT